MNFLSNFFARDSMRENFNLKRECLRREGNTSESYKDSGTTAVAPISDD